MIIKNYSANSEAIFQCTTDPSSVLVAHRWTYSPLYSCLQWPTNRGSAWTPRLHKHTQVNHFFII